MAESQCQLLLLNHGWSPKPFALIRIVQGLAVHKLGSGQLHQQQIWAEKLIFLLRRNCKVKPLNC